MMLAFLYAITVAATTTVAYAPIPIVAENIDNDIIVHTPPPETPAADELPVFNVTAYSDYGITADGNLVRDGIIACPKSFPFGTQFYLPDLGRTFTCHDRGGAIIEGHLDIYMKRESDAWSFGRRFLRAEIIRHQEG